MDNPNYSFSNSYDDDGKLYPSPKRGASCAQIVSLLSLMVAILAFLFGDNILGIQKTERIPPSETEIFAPTEAADDYALVIDNHVWEYSIAESKKYQTHLLTNEWLSDFEIEITLRFEDDQNEFHGIIFRQADAYQYYGFQITPSGDYKVYRRNGEEDETDLVGPTHSNSILTGNGQLNKLRIKAVGPKLEFFINSSLVASLTDTAFPKGFIALYTCTCNGSTSSAVSFYDLTITSLR